MPNTSGFFLLLNDVRDNFNMPFSLAQSLIVIIDIFPIVTWHILNDFKSLKKKKLYGMRSGHIFPIYIYRPIRLARKIPRKRFGRRSLLIQKYVNLDVVCAKV